MIVDGRKIAQNILEKLKKEVLCLKKQGKVLKLACVLVGRDPASISFIRRKEKSCEDLGIEFELFQFPSTINEKILIKKIRTIQNDNLLSGIIIQLPLPKKLDQLRVLEVIRPELDVDCLTPTNWGKLVVGLPLVLPPTASAILHILKIHKIQLAGKHIVIVGRGDLVGKPLAILLTQEKNTVTSCNKYTKYLGAITRQADILISGAGVPNLITEKMVKSGAIILDAGTSYYKDKLCGDVKFDKVKSITRLISPVPGGVGPVGVAKLLENTILLTKIKK